MASPLASPGRLPGRAALGGGRLAQAGPQAGCPVLATRKWLQRPYFGLLFKGAFFPNGSQLLSTVLTSIVDLLELAYLSIPPMILASF